MKKSMNNISQISIFDYREIENLGDLERLKMFFENIEDEVLCEKLEEERKNGTNAKLKYNSNVNYGKRTYKK